jgi:DNA-binding MarR family transcriptional regulator
MYTQDVYTSLPPDAIPCACTTVKKLSRVLGRVYDAGISSTGVNITQFAVLRCIARRSGEPLARIADELEMDRTSLYRAIAPMIRDGWIASNAASDARYRSAKLTKKGEMLLSSANRQWSKVQKRILGKFGGQAYERLLAEIYRMADCAEPAH